MKRICDRCGKSKLTEEVWFQNDVNKWCRHWCVECKSYWLEMNRDLLEALEKKKEDQKESVIKKIIKWMK